MKSAFFTLPVLLKCLAFSSPSFAAAMPDASPNPTTTQVSSTFKKHQNRSFLKQTWQGIFHKKQLRKKPLTKTGWLNFGWGALFLALLTGIGIFLLGFGVIAIFPWLTCITLAVIGLFKDDSKAAAIIALGLALVVLPIGVAIAISLAIGGE